MIRAHVTALLSLLQAVPNLTVYDGQAAEKPATPYVVLRTDSGLRGRSAVTAVSDQLTMTATLTCVGADRVQAQWAAEKATGALLDVRPTVASRTTSPIEHLFSQSVLRDDDVTPPLFYTVDQFRFLSVPG